MPSPTLPPGFDFTDPDLNRERLPVEELAELRRTAPIWWNEQPVDSGFHDGGYWVVTKHKDVKEISIRSDVFSSLEKTALPRFPEGATQEQFDTEQVRPAQHGRAAPHASAQDHLAWIHAAGRRAAASRPQRARPEHRQGGGGGGFRRLRRAGVVRAAACRPSPGCSACRWRTARSCSTGPTRWSATTTRSSPTTTTATPRSNSSCTPCSWPRSGPRSPARTSSPS